MLHPKIERKKPYKTLKAPNYPYLAEDADPDEGVRFRKTHIKGL